MQRRIMSLDIKKNEGSKAGCELAAFIYEDNGEEVAHIALGQKDKLPGEKNEAGGDYKTLMETFFSWYNSFRESCYTVISPANRFLLAKLFTDAQALRLLDGRSPRIVDEEHYEEDGDRDIVRCYWYPDNSKDVIERAKAVTVAYLNEYYN